MKNSADCVSYTETYNGGSYKMECEIE